MELATSDGSGTVSALTLGGGGIGGVLGPTDRAEAVATVHAAIDAGITHLDVAPTYGADSEAEQVVGLALRQRPAPEVMVTTKVEMPDDEYRDLPGRMRSSLEASLARLGRTGSTCSSPTPSSARGWRGHRAADPGLGAVPRRGGAGVHAAPRRRPDPRLGADRGGLPVGHPGRAGGPRPYAAQIVVNALDLTGDMWIFGDAGAPQNPTLLAAAVDADVPVMAIRAVASGALTDGLDRELDPDHPAYADFARAAGFRSLAADLGQTPATLAHRYALSVPGVATVVLGVKNRTELAEVVAAEAQGPLTEEEWQAVSALS